MKRVHDPRRLDVARFIAEEAVLQGRWAGTELDRLAQSQSAPQDMPLAAVEWRVAGQSQPVAGGPAECWLVLQAQTSAWLTCQRCLQPMALPLAVDVRIRFVQGEAEAEALDAESEEDVLALQRTFDLRSLIEDELLLALPLVPRHERCPQPLPVPLTPSEAPIRAAAENPFSVLQGLKAGARGEGPTKA